MGSSLQLVNGVARMVVQAANVVVFSEGYAATGLEIGSYVIGIPNSKTIAIGDELAFKLFINGQYLEITVDYTLIQDPSNIVDGQLNAVIVNFDLLDTDRLQFIGLEEAALVYDMSTSSLSLIAGNAYALPAAETYKDVELEVYLNGQLLENLIDYNYVGDIPRTQVTFTFDILTTDRLRFRKDLT